MAARKSTGQQGAPANGSGSTEKEAAPVVKPDSTELDGFYQDLEEVGKIDLDEDPVAAGLGSLHAKLSQVHARKVTLVISINRLNRILTEERIRLERLKGEFEARVTVTVSTHEGVVGLKTVGERRAAAEAIHADELRRLSDQENEVKRLQAASVAGSEIMSVLRAAKEALSRQVDVVGFQVQVGELHPAEWDGRVSTGTIPDSIRLEHGTNITPVEALRPLLGKRPQAPAPSLDDDLLEE